MPREADDWRQYPLILLPSPLTATDPIFVHLHTDFWERASAYVRDGGVLYASLAANAAIPDMSALFGARMTDTVVVSEVTLKIVKPLGSLVPGDTFRFTAPGATAKFWGTGLEVDGGEVIAVDENQRPALVAHQLGKGRTLLSAYPLEAWLGSQPEAFENHETAHRLYRALREWSGLRPRVSTDQPSVEAAALTGRARGYFVLVNHSGEALKTRLSTTLPVRELRRLDTAGGSALPGDQDGWNLELPAYGGAILEWRQP
jgi:hypothetical protein